ncbi:hypothetical protein HDF24_01090 [Mucilaginibacter sp. X4EP1]|uniref:hypothetical protein n=1 Tax=Mucilaginibacter sp. X4EP1 TaxID=2723092 RepID=UPI0021694DA3|nr:hypothetical protein [Mucilaginibacter sp. X4EP1]MCS3811610.1 hypothetical protein [Mucilaginibacter sp. X4EP1]
MPRTVITNKDVAKLLQDAPAINNIPNIRTNDIRELQTDIPEAAKPLSLIIAPAPGSPTDPPKADDYLSRLIKYIPTEIIALFVFIHPSLPEKDPDVQTYNWILFAFCVAVTPLYLWRLQKVTKVGQLIISTVACALWIFATGGPFAYWDWYKDHQFVATVVPALYTFLIPLIQAEA